MPQTRSKRSEVDQSNGVVPEDSDRPSKRARVNSKDPTTIASESSPTIPGKEEEDEEEEGLQPLEEIRASDLYLDTASPP